jgi:hypothetical protein
MEATQPNHWVLGAPLPVLNLQNIEVICKNISVTNVWSYSTVPIYDHGTVFGMGIYTITYLKHITWAASIEVDVKEMREGTSWTNVL